MVKLAFYKAYRGNWLDWLIAAYDFGKYSHVELVFSDGVCFSSSPRSKTGNNNPIVKGTRFIQIDDLETSGKWDIVELPFITESDEKLMRAWAVKEAAENKGYAFRDILHFLAPFITYDYSKWFCSEVDLACIQVAGYWTKWFYSDISPNNLYRISRGKEPRKIPWVSIVKYVFSTFCVK